MPNSPSKKKYTFLRPPLSLLLSSLRHQVYFSHVNCPPVTTTIPTRKQQFTGIHPIPGLAAVAAATTTRTIAGRLPAPHDTPMIHIFFYTTTRPHYRAGLFAIMQIQSRDRPASHRKGEVHRRSNRGAEEGEGPRRRRAGEARQDKTRRLTSPQPQTAGVWTSIGAPCVPFVFMSFFLFLFLGVFFLLPLALTRVHLVFMFRVTRIRKGYGGWFPS